MFLAEVEKRILSAPMDELKLMEDSIDAYLVLREHRVNKVRLMRIRALIRRRREDLKWINAGPTILKPGELP